MTRNTNVWTTAHLTDGRSVVIRHRNSLGGWAAALERAGLTIEQVERTTAGLLTEADRVTS